MNQLIKELALEAGGSHYPEVNTKQLIYFAELIIKECNKAVLEVPCYYKDYRSQIEEAVIKDCARAVLERFEMDDV